MNYSPLIVGLAFGLAPLAASAISLADALQGMQAHAPELAAAQLELRASAGDLHSAARRPVAELALGSGKYSRLEGLGPGKPHDKRLDSTVGVGWTWERGGKRHHRIAEAQSRQAAATFELLDVERSQRLAVHERYFTLKAASQALAVAQANLALSDAALQAVVRRIRSGDAPAIERDRLEIEHLKLDSDLRDADLHHQQAQQALALLIGVTDGAELLTADDDWPEPVAEAAPDVQQVLLHRADLRAAQQRVETAQHARALAHSQRKRDLGLAIEAEREPGDVAGVTWGLSISVPLHGPRHHDGERVRAQAETELAELALHTARREATAELQQLQRNWQQASARRALYEARVTPAANSLRDGMELAYQRGGASLTDLLDARRAAREAEQALIEARLQHVLAQAQWLAATELSSSTGTSP